MLFMRDVRQTLVRKRHLHDRNAVPENETGACDKSVLVLEL